MFSIASKTPSTSEYERKSCTSCQLELFIHYCLRFRTQLPWRITADRRNQRASGLEGSHQPRRKNSRLAEEHVPCKIDHLTIDS